MLIAALDAAAEFVEHPAGAAVEILVEERRRARRPRSTLRRCDREFPLRPGAARRFGDGRLEAADQVPGLRRQALADDGSGVARRSGDRQRRAMVRFVAQRRFAGKRRDRRWLRPRSRPRRRAAPSSVRSSGASCRSARRGRRRASTGSAPAAASPPRARDSARTRRDCRRRGSADCRARARSARLPAPAVGSRPPPDGPPAPRRRPIPRPSPIDTARASSWSEMRQKPPGITRQPCGVAAA